MLFNFRKKDEPSNLRHAMWLQIAENNGFKHVNRKGSSAHAECIESLLLPQNTEFLELYEYSVAGDVELFLGEYAKSKSIVSFCLLQCEHNFSEVSLMAMQKLSAPLATRLSDTHGGHITLVHQDSDFDEHLTLISSNEVKTTRMLNNFVRNVMQRTLLQRVIEPTLMLNPDMLCLSYEASFRNVASEGSLEQLVVDVLSLYTVISAPFIMDSKPTEY